MGPHLIFRLSSLDFSAVNFRQQWLTKSVDVRKDDIFTTLRMDLKKALKPIDLMLHALLYVPYFNYFNGFSFWN